MPLPTRPEDFDLSNIAGLTEDVISAGVMVQAGKLMLLAKTRLLVAAVVEERERRLDAFLFPELK